jgi:hypothetical protein
LRQFLTLTVCLRRRWNFPGPDRARCVLLGRWIRFSWTDEIELDPLGVVGPDLTCAQRRSTTAEIGIVTPFGSTSANMNPQGPLALILDQHATR